jgi:hypothetical protein
MENQKEEVTREKKKGQDKGKIGAVFMRGYPRLVKGDRLKIC